MAKLRLLLLDACVLIDFAKTDVSLITLVSRHVGDVHVATPVFEEVHDLDPAMAVSLGIKLHEPSLDVVIAAATRRGRLSFQDRLCLLVAKECGCTCVSNDRRLRTECQAEGVPVLWGLEVIALLVERRALAPEGARDIAERIAASNKRLGRAVLQQFYAKIRRKT